MSFTLRDLPKYERRERLHELGAHSLSLHELLELVLGKGSGHDSVFTISQQLLTRYKSLREISSASIQDLCQINGIGYAKAIQIKAAFELGKRFQLEDDSPMSEAVLRSVDAYRMASYYLKDKKKEHLLLFCLDVRGRLINKPETVSIGTLDSSLVHPREIFNSAIKNHSSKIILAHNHPSGSSQPSDQDYVVTNQLYDASKIVGIELLDHIVLGRDEFSSIRENNPQIFA